MKRAKTVLQMLYDSNDSTEFCEAFDWESTYRITLALGLNDYPQLIKFPMDLGTVPSKLQAKTIVSWSKCSTTSNSSGTTAKPTTKADQ